MVAYLSDAWLDGLQSALETADVPESPRRLVVHHRVDGGPDGDAAFHVVLDGSAVTVARGAPDDADVTFRQTYATAAGIARGEMSAQGAFLAGLLRISGDVALLVEHADAFGAVDDALDALRLRTDFA